MGRVELERCHVHLTQGEEQGLELDLALEAEVRRGRRLVVRLRLVTNSEWPQTAIGWLVSQMDRDYGV